MLSVDKIGTAINIAYACNLINNEMKQFIISSETDGIRDIENRGDQVEIANFIKEEVKRELKKYHEEAHLHILSGPKIGTYSRWEVLDVCIRSELRVMLLNLSLSVNFCVILFVFF